jgi:hypothetical protein
MISGRKHRKKDMHTCLRKKRGGGGRDVEEGRISRKEQSGLVVPLSDLHHHHPS